ncbi:large ribosomal subunit protein mL43 [Phlebotomus argentipes]|uniref:large ribosomal subunit protein mL43 n=1 Tax=Phlebotomus argentipes TaxID=94469 RepID=UPI0028934435|nr:large ribosomal subunit protein mL43 [Phlebotomus argentipes]
MSNSHIFMKSGFPRAPLQNGMGRYVCQLQRLTLKYCKSYGASKGMRDYLENSLLDYAKANPGVAVYVKPRRHRTPVIVAEYLNGERQWLPCANRPHEEIIKWMELLRQQNSDSSAVRWRKLWHTDVPSIQGVWTPFTHRNPQLNLTVFPDEALREPVERPKSATEIVLEMLERRKLE